MESVLVFSFTEQECIQAISNSLKSKYDVNVIDCSAPISEIHQAANKATKILAISCVPERYVAKHLKRELSALNASVEGAAEHWSAAVNAFIEVIIENRDKSFVIDEDVLQSPDENSVDSIYQYFGLQVNLSSWADEPEPAVLLNALALLGADHHVYVEYEELVAISNVRQTIADYKVRVEVASQQASLFTQEIEKQLSNLKQDKINNAVALEKLASDNELSLLQVHQLQEELQHSASALQQSHELNTEIKAELAEQVNQLESANNSNDNLKKDIQGLHDQLESTHAALSASEADKQISLLQVHQLQEELEQAFVDLQQSREANQAFESRIVELQGLEAESKSQQQTIEQLNQQLAAVSSELTNSKSDQELTLLQVHQLQEELEQMFVKLQESKIANQASETRIIELQGLEAESKSQQQTIEQLNQQLAAVSSELTNSKADQELSLLQIHQLQEELEQTHLNLEEAKRLSQGLESKVNEFREREFNNTAQNHQLDLLQQELMQEKAALQDMASDNELSMLQIHQLQEELEFYYLKLTEAEAKMKELESVQYFSDIPPTTLTLLGSLHSPVSEVL